MKKLLKKLWPPKEDIEHLRIQHRHKRELLQIARQSYDFSYAYLDEFVRVKIVHMHEYFSSCTDIWQTEESRAQIIEQLQHVLDLWGKIDTLWENYNNSIIRNEDGSIAQNKRNAVLYLEALTREGELYKEIYSYIGEWIQFWED